MTAEEARKLTQKALHDQNGVVGERLRQVLAVIERAAGDGLLSLDIDYYFRGLNSEQQRVLGLKLNELGYSLKFGEDQREGSWRTVGWALAQ